MGVHTYVFMSNRVNWKAIHIICFIFFRMGLHAFVFMSNSVNKKSGATKVSFAQSNITFTIIGWTLLQEILLPKI